MSFIFISDLHLDEKQPQIGELFLRFLKTDTKQAQALFILGDFFETWIGDDNLTPFNCQIMSALAKETKAGLPIYFIHGNRDFLLGKQFFKETGCQLLPPYYRFNLFGTPTLLMHGDTLCTDDIEYIKARKKMRNWFIKKWFLMQKLAKRRHLADQYRARSKMHISSIADEIMDVNQQAVEKIMLKFKVTHLIHGHTHRQNVHHFDLNNHPVKRTVLGAWHTRGNALICRPNQAAEFINIE